VKRVAKVKETDRLGREGLATAAPEIFGAPRTSGRYRRFDVIRGYGCEAAELNAESRDARCDER